MGIVFRQSVKTTIVIFLGALLGALIIWLSTNYLGRQELGFLRALTNNSVVATQLLLLGLQNTIAVYMHKYADSKSKRGLLIAGCLIIPFVVITISTALYFLFKDQFITHLFQPKDFALVARYFIWLPVFAILMMYQVLLEQYLVSQVIVALSSFVREVILRACNIIIILLYGFGIINFDFFIAGMVLTYLVPIFVYLFFSLRTKAFAFSLNYKALSRAEVIDVAKFTWYHSLLSVSLTLIGFLDTLMLQKLDKNGFASVAIYTNAIFFISLLQMPYKAMISATFPVLAAAFKDNDLAKVQDLFTRSSLNILVGATFMAIIVICNIHNATALMPSGYEVINVLVAILIVGSFTDMATGMNGQVLSISNFYRFNFYMSIALVFVMLLLNYLLIPRIGIYGAAWANAISLMSFNIAKFFFVWKKLHLQPFSKNSILVLLAGLPALVVGYYFPYLFNRGHHIYIHSFLDVTIRSSLIVVVYLLMLLWLKPSKDMEEYIASIKKNKRLF